MREPSSSPTETRIGPAVLAVALAGFVAVSQAQAQEGGAPQAPARTPEEERAAFHLAGGFSAELVASEAVMPKVVDVAFDDHGRMWAVTAREYPLDGNETPGAAAVYERGGRDQVLVFERPWAEGLQEPRVFADGLVMPMAILPEADSVLIGHGPDILRLFDDDGDGRADRREVVLTGFGIQDSHLLPHRFVRASGGWVYLAQGAFNSSQVRTGSGEVVAFDKCKVGRFQRDGSRFEVVGVGLNNIWGFVLDRGGDRWIQEANDLGYPLVPFEHGASYPGIGNQKARPHSPWRPRTAEFRMGGTGLSGLALSEDRDGFPAPWDETFFIANPILSAIQAIRVTRRGPDGGDLSLERAEDLLTSEDRNFRPVAIHFGPDGCLYVVDWYNPIISHNEVPRDHPERDKHRTRIWRIRHESQDRRTPTDVGSAVDGELVDLLRSPSTWVARAAWHQIADRRAVDLGPELARLAQDAGERTGERVLALWALEDLALLDGELLAALARSPEPALRREAARLVAPLTEGLGEGSVEAARRLAWVRDEVDLRVRLAAIGALASLPRLGTEAVSLLLAMERDPAAPRPSPAREADVAFERSRLRVALEGDSPALVDLLETEGALSDSGRALALVCLEGLEGAQFVARELARGGRGPSGEELALLAPHLGDPPVRAAVEGWLSTPAERGDALSAVLELAEVHDLALLAESVTASLLAHRREAPGEEGDRLLLRGARVMRLGALEDEVLAILDGGRAEVLDCLEALVACGASDGGLYYDLALASVPTGPVRRRAATALAGLGGEEAFALTQELWPMLERPTQRAVTAALVARREGARRVVAALGEGTLPPSILDRALLERLATQLGDDPALAAVTAGLAEEGTPVLYLDGGGGDFADTDLALSGPFTVEAWVRFAEPLTNADGLLCGSGDFDLNFHDARPRLWCGSGLGDVIVAEGRVRPDTWTHVALTRDAGGILRLFLDGELDQTSTTATPGRFEGLDIGRTTPGTGTTGALAEVRLWDRARTAEEIGASFRLRLEASAGAGEGPRFILPGARATLSGNARIVGAHDPPPAVTREEARAEAERFAVYRTLAAAGGDAPRGQAVFARMCGVCHTVGDAGTEIGPALDGVAAKGREGLLRSILTPNAGVESGYRTLVVRTDDGLLLTGFLAREEPDAILLRRTELPDLRLSRARIESLRFDSLSLMPEGLLESLAPGEVSDLFAYLETLR
ncbi:MAG: c-type cytochrome [Planctomycetota bacterium]|nr:c-type cytochrome [Planctomycetota bacterium]